MNTRRSVRRSVFLILLVSLTWVVWGEARQPDFHLAGELQTHREIEALSGSSIEAVFHFIDAEPAAHEFSADLYQMATALAAPITRELQPSVSPLKPGSVVGEVHLSVQLPIVRRETAFLIRLMTRRAGAEIWQVTGRITVVVRPDFNGEAPRSETKKF